MTNMIELDLSDFNIVVTLLGGFITLFGLVSYILKERFFISEALIALLFGVAVSNHGLGWFDPMDIASNDHENLETITLNFTRLVLACTLFLAGISLPADYPKKHWKDLLILLGPVMTTSWLVSALIIFLIAPDCTFLMSLAISACITPTDPVLSNSVVKGKFADAHVPFPIQTILSAESGTNDGFALPFAMIALNLIKLSTGEAFKEWAIGTILYELILGVVIGGVVGFVGRKALKYAEDHDWVDRESFFVHAVCLAFFVVGLCGLLGSGDLLACFVAGSTFAHDDWFKEKTEKDSLQPSVDMLLNMSIFMWFGAVCPWHEFYDNASGLTIWKLIGISILVLVFRRLPAVWLAHSFIPAISGHREALFVGYFGPMGVGAVYYIEKSREILKEVPGETAERTSELIRLIVWFVVISSIVVHGLSIPLLELGFKFNMEESGVSEILPEIVPATLRSWWSSLLGRSRTVADSWQEQIDDSEHQR